jgi:hypothetical protein
MSAVAKPAAVLLAAAMLGGCTPAAISDAERHAVLTPADLAAYGYPKPSDPEDETWEAWWWFDGSKEIEYSYETIVEGQPKAFSIYVSLSLENTNADALASYGASVLGYKVGSEAATLARVELTDACDYAERCALFLIAYEGKPLGNQFILQAGRAVYSVQIAGLYFDEPGPWHEIITPKIDALQRAATQTR